MDSFYPNITKLILQVLNRVRKPVEPDEIAFRVRSTTSIVNDELDKLVEANLVNKQDNKYSIINETNNSTLEALYY